MSMQQATLSAETQSSSSNEKALRILGIDANAIGNSNSNSNHNLTTSFSGEMNTFLSIPAADEGKDYGKLREVAPFADELNKHHILESEHQQQQQSQQQQSQSSRISFKLPFRSSSAQQQPQQQLQAQQSLTSTSPSRDDEGTVVVGDDDYERANSDKDVEEMATSLCLDENSNIGCESGDSHGGHDSEEDIEGLKELWKTMKKLRGEAKALFTFASKRVVVEQPR